MNRRLHYIAILIAALFVLGTSAVVATPPSDMHCPAGWTEKFEGNYNSTVLPAGTQFCVKAATNNSGILTSDGTTSLLGYVTWLNNGEQTPDVSYYVVYTPPPSQPPSAPPSSPPSAPPSQPPSAPPSSPPSAPPSAPPSDPPSCTTCDCLGNCPTPPPTPTPPPSDPPPSDPPTVAPTPAPRVTPPPTSTEG